MALGIPGSDPSDSAGAIFALFSYVSDTLEIYSESVRQVAENDIPSFYFGGFSWRHHADVLGNTIHFRHFQLTMEIF